MRYLGRAILLFVLCFAAAQRVWPASDTVETHVFDAAQKEYLDAFYKDAAAAFDDFVKKFPASSRVPEAILFQAQARIKLGDYDGALNLLSLHWSQAGPLTDEYLFCEAEALLAQGEFARADAAFTRLATEFPGSQRRLAAVVNAAVARMRLSKWAQVIEPLAETNGLFQSVAATNRANPLVVRGYLLLGEAQLAQNDTRAADLSLQALAGLNLDQTNSLQRQYLQCRVMVAEGQLEAAMENTSNLLALAKASGQRSFQADTIAFQAGLLERLGRREDALAAYQQNLAAGTPPERQRQALLQTIELSLALGRIADVAQVLQTFLGQFPTNECSDLALLTLGEMRLYQYESGLTNQTLVISTNTPPATNLLDQALGAFQKFQSQFPQSPLLGKAQLDLGWCYWLGSKVPESRVAFQSAVAFLPRSLDQGKACFKLGDAEFVLSNYTAAISNYNTVIERFADFAEVRTNLAEPALYQVVRASLAVNDVRQATNALATILALYPDGFYTDRAVLLTGQQVGQRYPAVARGLYEDFARRATNSPLLPELNLAIARSYEEEANWDAAIRQYDNWLMTFTNDPAQGRTEYLRAEANYQAGNETNAFVQFTNFIARFPTNEFAPVAQWWLGDHFYRLGKLVEAESNYRLVFQNWPSSPNAYLARLTAGRVAVDRQDWNNAPAYFTNLVKDANCPAELRAQALFAYGDTLLLQNSTNKLYDYQEASKTFDFVCKIYPTNQIAALAWGQKAICHLQFASASRDYSQATNAFQQVIDSPLANATARSIAEVGLGFALEKLADDKPEPEKTELLNSAMRHYKRVFYDNGFLREGETADPFWTRKAGMDAGRLAERLQLREQAINVYRRLQEMFPPLRLDDRIKNLSSQG